MVARVVPYKKLSRGRDFFDYNIPQGVDLRVGSFVEIPFGRETLLGMVWAIVENAATEHVELRDISGVNDYEKRWIDSRQRDLISWAADHYAVSYGTVLRAMQPQPLKRCREVQIAVMERHENPVNVPFSLDMSPTGASVIRYSHRGDLLSMYGSFSDAVSGSLVVLVAERQDMNDVAASLSGAVHIVPEQTSPSYWTTLESRLRTEPLRVVGTRKLALRDLSGAEAIIVHDEGALYHKQTESSFRFHARDVALRYASSAAVLLTDPAPSMSAYRLAQEEGIPITPLPSSREEGMTVIDMESESRSGENSGWFSRSVAARIARGDRGLLLLNRTGHYGISVCSECGEAGPPDSEKCSECGSVELKRRRKGTAALETELRYHAGGRTFVRLDRDQTDESVLRNASAADLVLGTERALRLTDPSSFDFIVLLSVDHLLAYPDFRAHERTFRLLRHLASYGVPMMVQTYVSHHAVIRAAAAGNYDEFAAAEFQMRELLQRPPIIPLYRIVAGDRERLGSTVSDPAEVAPHVVLDRIE